MIRALGCDFDRTLTDDELVVRPETLDALRLARTAGLKIVVVSGRDAAFLLDAVGDAVDLVVAENGGFIVDPVTREETPLFATWPGAAALDAFGIPLVHARAMAHADVAHAAALERALAAAGHACRVERNVDRVMVLPEGVEKAAGFLAALGRLGVAPEEAAAVGDGENDLSLLRVAGRRVAVANAVPELKRMAHEVTRAPGGAGVREWLLWSWMPSRDRWLPSSAAQPG